MLGWKKSEKRKLNMEGINLLAAILLCYPEIGTVSYEPRQELLHFTFALRQKPEQAEYDKACQLIEESIKTYQALEKTEEKCRLEFFLEGGDGLVLLHIKRDFRSVSQGEIRLLATLLRECFGQLLLVENKLNREDRELVPSREEAIDHFLSHLRTDHVAEQLVGIREGGKVTVFNK